jgi:hypothetical protein
VFNAQASGRCAAARSILPQRFQHDLADRPAGLLRERAGEIGGLGVADVELIFQETAPCGDVGTSVLSSRSPPQLPPGGRQAAACGSEKGIACMLFY